MLYFSSVGTKVLNLVPREPVSALFALKWHGISRIKSGTLDGILQRIPKSGPFPLSRFCLCFFPAACFRVLLSQLSLKWPRNRMDPRPRAEYNAAIVHSCSQRGVCLPRHFQDSHKKTTSRLRFPFFLPLRFRGTRTRENRRVCDFSILAPAGSFYSLKDFAGWWLASASGVINLCLI